MSDSEMQAYWANAGFQQRFRILCHAYCFFIGFRDETAAKYMGISTFQEKTVSYETLIAVLDAQGNVTGYRLPDMIVKSRLTIHGAPPFGSLGIDNFSHLVQTHVYAPKIVKLTIDGGSITLQSLKTMLNKNLVELTIICNVIGFSETADGVIELLKTLPNIKHVEFVTGKQRPRKQVTLSQFQKARKLEYLYCKFNHNI